MAISMSWAEIHSRGPWMFCMPVKRFGQGTPISVSREPSVPPRIGTERGSMPSARAESRASSTGVMSDSSQ